MSKEAWQNLTAAYFGAEVASGSTFIYDDVEPHPLLTAERFEGNAFATTGGGEKPHMDVTIEESYTSLLENVCCMKYYFRA